MGHAAGRKTAIVPPNVAEILDRCRLFADVEPAGFARLATIARLCGFEKGQIVFRQRQPCPGAYVVGQGLVRVFQSGTSGKEHVLHMASAGETFAEVAAIGGFECPATAEAVEPTLCALLPAEPLRKILREDHQLCLGMLAGLTRWVRHLVGLMEDIALRDAAGRLARFLLDSSADEQGVVKLPARKRHVASHLNLTSETFSRTLRRLVDARLVAQPDGNRIELLDKSKLAQVAAGLFPKI